MGLFGGNYSKPGPGVTKEQAAKRNYFEILGRKFWKLIELNLLYAVCTILFWGGSIFLALPYLFELDTLLESLAPGQPIMVPLLPFLPLMLMGPFTAGLTYVLRNYARQEHAFMVSDFFEHSRKNWKQGLLASVLGIAVLYLFVTAFFFYLTKISLPVLLAITFVMGMLLISMTFYVYPMMVTFQMKFTHILKNAWIFALAKFPQNLFFAIIIFGVHFALLWYVPVIWMILMPIILVAWSGYTMNYYVWHVMDKYMMPKDDKLQEEAVFDDNIKQDKDGARS